MRQRQGNSATALFLSALFATGLLWTLPWVPVARADEDTAPAHRVRDRIARQGHARVIVALRLPSGAPTPEGHLPTVGAVINQRRHIAAAQAQVRSNLAGTRHAELHAYATAPLIVLDIDADALNQLESSGEVVHVWEDKLRVPTLAQSVPLVQGNQAWSAGYDGTGQVVAIIDTGVDKSHPFLLNKVVEEACYSSIVPGQSSSLCPNGQSQQIGAGAGVPCSPLSLACWHGTHVAGIAAGNGDQAGQTFSGVAKGARIVSVQIFSLFTPQACGSSSSCIMAWTSDIIAGLERVYALSGQYEISSVNLSLGGGLYSGACDDEPEKGIIDNLRSVGIATVIAAGNDSSRSKMSSPGCISTAVSVGSTSKTDVVSDFSNAATTMDVWAPGYLITSSYPGNQYATASGTSMATPHVTGAFAVVRQAAPDASVDDILSALQQTGLPITDTRTGGTVTKPRIRILQALQALVPIPMNPLPALTSLSPSTATAGGAGFTLTVNGSNFIPTSVIRWNGVARTTTYLSSGQLTMAATAVDVATQGSATVTVVNPTPGGGTSNSKSLTISAPAGFTLTVTRVGNGTVTSSPAGISCGATCSVSYASGKKVTLQASAAQGYRFTGWSGACSGTGSCSVTMTKNTAVTATFAVTYTLNVTLSGTGFGSVSSTPSGINCGSTCSAGFVSGQQVTLKASATGANQKSTFTGWSGACSGTGTCIVTMSAAKSVGATFTRR